MQDFKREEGSTKENLDNRTWGRGSSSHRKFGNFEVKI